MVRRSLGVGLLVAGLGSPAATVAPTARPTARPPPATAPRQLVTRTTSTTWDYYENVLGRNGGNAYINAFWDGTEMTYGDGDGNARRYGEHREPHLLRRVPAA